MKVILQETLDGVGHLGDLINVADGFARNYLLPRGKAVEANSRSIKAFEHAKRVAAEKATARTCAWSSASRRRAPARCTGSIRRR